MKNPSQSDGAHVAGLTSISAAAATVIGLLEADHRELLVQIARGGRGHFGARSTQSVFDEALPALEALYSIGAEHDHIADLLADLGIRDPHGLRLSRGTVSSAVYRARMKDTVGRKKTSPASSHQFIDAPSVDRGSDWTPGPPRSDQLARAGPPPAPPLPGNAASLATAAAFIHQLRDQDD